MNRKAASNIACGILLILAGAVIIGQIAGLWNASFILNGWWTLFLIVPAIAGIITTGPRFGNIFLLVLGVWLFLDSQGWLGKEGWPLLLGFILIAAGISVMTGSGHTHHRHHHGDGDESRPEENRKD